MAPERYYETLKQIHAIQQPSNYLEVGVRRGDSWQLVQHNTRSIGIDPEPKLMTEPPGDAKLFVGTSNAFFEQHDPKAILGKTIDLAFIDGMHLFEYALRDFTNIERHCAPDSTILLHDCLPIDEETSGRTPLPDIWTGDIWKVVICLKECRPDLQIDVVDVAPSGLGVIRNLNPNAQAWQNDLEAVIARFKDLPYAYLGDSKTMRELLNVCDAQTSTLAGIIHAVPKTRRQSHHRLS